MLRNARRLMLGSAIFSRRRGVSSAIWPGLLVLAGCTSGTVRVGGADSPACADAVVASSGCTCGATRHTDGICCSDTWHADGLCCSDTWHADGFCCAGAWQASACATCLDGDGDGYSDARCGGDDCNDADAGVHPGAIEVCADGIDQDCTGGDLPCPVDVTPPVISAGQPTGALPSGTKQVTMSVATNTVATCKWAATPGTPYGSMPNMFSTTGATTHSTSITSLVDGQSYVFYVRCQDAAGHPNVSDYAMSFSVSGVVQTDLAPASTIAAITAFQTQWATTPLPDTANGMTGAVHYFCDCQAGAAANCASGSDANDGLTISTPKQSLSAVAALFPPATGDTIAFCKGGYWDASSDFRLNKHDCTTGTTCTDFRDYDATGATGGYGFASPAKPTISLSMGNQLFNFSPFSGGGAQSGDGGVRIFNLHFTTAVGTSYVIHIDTVQHDIWFENNTIDAVVAPMYNDANEGHSTRIHFDGNTLSNIPQFSYLGGSQDSTIKYNYMTGVGSDTVFNHSIYAPTSGAGFGRMSNFQIKGNYFEAGPQGAAVCNGIVISGHGLVDNLQVTDNYIYVDPAKATIFCSGIGEDDETNNANPVGMSNSKFLRNVIINAGVGISVSNCPGCLIGDNLIISDWGSTQEGVGISQAPTYGGRTQDDIASSYTIVNNTIFFGSSMTKADGNGYRGIRISESSGHIIANNTISILNGFANCLAVAGGYTALSYSDYNNCYETGATNQYERVSGTTLAGWTSLSGLDTHSITADPAFTSTTIPYDFRPQSGSPLIGAGTSAHAPTTDAMGVTRPNPPTIGAYE